MVEQVTVRSVKQYWEDFILNGLKEKESHYQINQKVVNAFLEEMQGLMKFRLKVSDLKMAPPTEKNRRKVESTAKETFKKWNSLCSLCRRYKETRDILRPEDLKWEDEGRDASEEADYNEDDVGDDGYPMPEMNYDE